MPATRSGWVSLIAVLYLISGTFNLLIGLVGLGVSLGESDTVDTVYIGDWATHDLTGASIVLMVLGALQLLLGAGIWRRERWAWFAGLVIASLVIVYHIFFQRNLDGWALGGVIPNILIVWILLAKEREFVA